MVLSVTPARFFRKYGWWLLSCLTARQVRWGAIPQSVSGLWHVIVLCASGPVCSCGGAAGGRQLCRHAAAVDEVMRKKHGGAHDRVRIGRVPRRCSRGCGSTPSTSLIKYGRRRCRQKTERRYMCRLCGRTFSGTDGFRGRHSPA